MGFIIRGLVWLLDIYSMMIFACIVLSFFPELQRNKIAEILSNLVDPFLAPFRKIMPPIGMLDISATVALLLLHFAARGLASW